MSVRRIAFSVAAALVLVACSESPTQPPARTANPTASRADATPADTTQAAASRGGNMFGSGT